MSSPLVSIPLLALVLTILLHQGAIHFFPRWKLLDFPTRYGLKRRALPYPTGIIAVIVFLCIFPFLQVIDRSVLGVMGAIILLGISCFIDDRRSLSPFLRLLIQACAALLVFYTGDCTGSRICSVTNPLEGIIGGSVIELNGAWPILSVVVTVVWLMLTTNALNWFDGIPGQVNTLSTIGFFIIGLLSLSERVDQPMLALIAFTVAAIAFGSLLFDYPPPRVVTGDSGSMFFGLMLGILTVYAGGKVATAFLVLGVPIIDLLFVMTKRIWEGRSPFRGSMSGEHLHHRLLAKEWSPHLIIALTACIGGLFGVSALFLSTFGKFIAACVLTLIMLGLWVYSRAEDARLRK